jgi:hypothetical protein
MRRFLAFDIIAFMSTTHIVALLIAERDKLNSAIEALQGTKTVTVAAVASLVAESTAPKKKRFISAATRRKMALGQQKRYAAKLAAAK